MSTYGQLEAYTYGGLEAFTYGQLEAATTLRTVSLTVNFAGVALTNVLSARGEIAADTGWPTCSVFVTSKPTTGNEEDSLSVIAGAGNNVTRFTGRVRRFRPSGFPKAIEMVATGTLAYANEWAPAFDIHFGTGLEYPNGESSFFPNGGVTDQQIVQFVLSQVPGVSYSAGDIGGTSIPLGIEPGIWAAFDWKAGTTAWAYIQNLDRATLYRTYQDRMGTIRRVKMIGHPDSTLDFTLANRDILDGASGDRNTEQTRNAVQVKGHDYGKGVDITLGTAYGSNAFQGDGTNPALRHPEAFQSELIQSGYDGLGNFWNMNGGLSAQDIANAILPDVNKEFVEASVPSWRDDTHGPGMTCLLDCLDRLAIGEPMWVARHAWEVGDNGWIATYGLTGGGLPQTNPDPPV